MTILVSIFDFATGIMASIIAYYVCKWFDTK